MNDQSERTNATLDAIIGENWESLLSQVPRSVLIRLSPEAVNNLTGQMISAFIINMIIRLFPVVTNVYLQISIDGPLLGNMPKHQDTTFITSIKDLYNSVKPDVNLHINSKPDGNEICSHITIGSEQPLKIPGVWVGSDNWIARISSIEPQKISPAINPIGACTAATLAISETWKRILQPLQKNIKYIIITPLDGTLKFSTIDYTMNGDGVNPDMPQKVNLKRLTMIGLGAGGGAAAYTLASIPELQGTITLIDPDEIEPSNLNRYVYADYHDAKERKPKVECIKELFISNPEIKVRTIQQPYLTAKDELEIQDYELVVAAVDNRKTRRDIQFETPKIILDAAATGKGDFMNWRMILEETECMICKHPHNEEDAEVQQAEQLSKVFGLDPDIWLRKSGNNDIFSDEEVKIISATANNLDHQVDLPEAGQRYQEWFKNNCGRLELPDIEGEVPIPFAPVMSGILQAGEVIKENLFPESVLKGYYWNTLTAMFNPNIQPQVKGPQRDCSFCSDDTFIKQYKRRWSH